jgi:putative FmdB family regulatory protein
MHFFCRLNIDREDVAMPLYGYECNACGREFETLVRSSETPSCPSCESTDLTRQLSLIATPAKSTGGDAPMCGGAGGCGMCPGMLD